MCSRLLDTLGFDMPTSEVILENANKTFFRFFAQFCTANMTKRDISDFSMRGRQAHERLTQHDT